MHAAATQHSNTLHHVLKLNHHFLDKWSEPRDILLSNAGFSVVCNVTILNEVVILLQQNLEVTVSPRLSITHHPLGLAKL